VKQTDSIVTIRKAALTDLPAITEIYNEAVLTTTATFDNQPKTLKEQEIWFNSHNQKHPILVAETHAGVIGWASLSEWSTRCAYADTAEISIYIKEVFRNQGIGKQLMKKLILAGERCGLHTVLSRIVEGNDSSIHLHEKAGFVNVGTMREVGYKFDKLLDVRIMQLIYDQVPKP
jgi:L-amino acid N-acyltransferase